MNLTAFAPHVILDVRRHRRATLVLMLLMAFTPSFVSATVQIPDDRDRRHTRALLTEPEPFVRYLKDSGSMPSSSPTWMARLARHRGVVSGRTGRLRSQAAARQALANPCSRNNRRKFR